MSGKLDEGLLGKTFNLRELELRNRIVFSPVSTRMALPDGAVGLNMQKHYGNIAAGGAAVVITEALHVDDIASKFAVVQPSIFSDCFIPGLSMLSDEVHIRGAYAIAQLGHAGRQTTYAVNGKAPVVPSQINSGLTRGCKELTSKEIKKIIHSFGNASERAYAAGFDGIEIHAGNGYLINQFLSPNMNKRSDEYGKNRSLFLMRIIEEISNKIKKRVLIGVRLGCSDFVDGGLEEKEVLDIALRIPSGEIAYLHTSAGVNESCDFSIQPIYVETAPLKNIASHLKAKCEHSIILTGSVNSVGLANELLSVGCADLIGMGRPLLSDPNLPILAMSGKGRKVRPCIRCNQGCIARVREGKTVRCSVNPKIGYDSVFFSGSNHHEKNSKLRVLIAGGGPAGIAAALRAREVGCSVKLVENNSRLGGLLNTARHEPFKHDIVEFLNYQIRILKDSGIEQELDRKVDASVIDQEKPDILVDATGSIPHTLKVPCHLPYIVVDIRELLLGSELPKSGSKVIIIGGGTAGCELGNTLSKNGVEVTIIEQNNRILCDLEPISALALHRILSLSKPKILVNTRFLSFESEGVRVEGKDELLPADMVVVSIGSRPNDRLQKQTTKERWKLGLNYIVVGDAYRVGKVYDAIHSGYWKFDSVLGINRGE